MKAINKEYLERVAHLMKDRRVALSFKQSEAAARSGINLRTLQRFEQTGEINFDTLLRLMVLYRMDKRVVAAIEDRAWWTIEELERAETKRTVR